MEMKVHRGMCEELLSLYGFFLTSYKYTDEHEQLLAEHIKDMYHRLEVMDRNMAKSGTLALSNSECLAFVQTWSVIDTSRWPLANVIILDMIKKIDLRVKQPKAYATHR